MNKIIMILLLTISTTAITKECINKKKYIEYYYLNGIAVQSIENQASLLLVKNNFKIASKVIELYNPTEYQGEYLTRAKDMKYKLDNDKNLSEREQEDLREMISIFPLKDAAAFALSAKKDIKYEVFVQKREEYIRSLYNETNIKKKERKNDPTVMEKLIDGFLTKISIDKANVVISHSQGNLIANEMCLRIKDNKDKYGPFEIISIASPGSDLPCNKFQTYVLYYNDIVINGLRLLPLDYDAKFLNPKDGVMPTVFKYNKQTKKMEKSTDPLSHYLFSYLGNPKIIKYLNEQKEKTVDYLINENLSFDFLAIDLKYDKKDFINKIPDHSKLLGSGLVNFYLDFQRRKIDMMSNAPRNRHRINYVLEEWQVLLDTPFNVQNDKTYAYSIQESFARSVKMCGPGSRINPEYKFVCQRYSINGRSPASHNNMEPEVSWWYEKQRQKLKVSCKDAIIGKSNLKIDYISNNEKDQKISLWINDVEYNSKIKKSEKTTKAIANIAEIDFKEKEDIISYEIGHVEKITPPDSYSLSSEYHNCDTYRKLGSPKCSGYLTYLESLM